MTNRILVWDVPIRLFHWLLAASFAGAYLTAETERYRDLHIAFGYTMLGLIAFRLLWGLIGTRYARFSSFAFGPAKVLAYLRSLFTRMPMRFTGHNPAGSWAIYGLLVLGVLSAASGYAAYEEIGGDWMRELHEGFANSMLVLVVFHVAGVVVSSLMHRENLIRAMLTGFKDGEPQQAVRRTHRLIGIALLAGTIALWNVVPGLLAPDQAGSPRLAEAHERSLHHQRDR